MSALVGLASLLPAQDEVPADRETLIDACGVDPGWTCEWTFEATENETLAQVAEFVVTKPLKILFILAVAWLLSRLVRRGIKRFVRSIETGVRSGRFTKMRQLTPNSLLDTGEVNLRSAARAQTIAIVLRSVSSVIIWGIALIYIFNILGFELGPLLAGAGIVGVAIGFGAQSLVKDFLSGIFMLIEDQYGVGDIVDLGEASGVVEGVSLRSTRLRDVDGTVWHVPNGEIRRVGNKSQQWARALLDVTVTYGTDISHATDVIKRVADDVWRDEDWSDRILEEPEVWGVEDLGPDGVIIRLVVKTQPATQFDIMRQLRVRLKEAFEAEGIELPYPQTAIVVRPHDEDEAPPIGPADGERRLGSPGQQRRQAQQ
jgi:moderate conductance mechanosensitive channel